MKQYSASCHNSKLRYSVLALTPIKASLFRACAVRTKTSNLPVYLVIKVEPALPPNQLCRVCSSVLAAKSLAVTLYTQLYAAGQIRESEMSFRDKELKIRFSPGHVELVEEEVCSPDRRVLVTGATGLLGRAVYKEFHNNGWATLGCGYNRARPRFLCCNLLDEDAVRAVILSFQPHVIIHCAAERRPDVVEHHTEAALNLNVHACATLAKEAAGVYLIYISTDYVFDGRNPPYGENDTPNPLNMYGKSKLRGEEEILRHCPGAAILRVPILYGEVEKVEESAVTVLWDRIQEGMESSTVDHCQQRFPTYTGDVARVCRNMAERGLQDSSLRGIFHFSGKEQMTKYEIACAIADAFNLHRSHLIPLTEQPAGAGAQRPQNAQLECSRLELLGLSVEPTPFKTAIRKCLWPFLHDKRWRQTVFH